jgi:hypothetical protein
VNNTQTNKNNIMAQFTFFRSIYFIRVLLSYFILVFGKPLPVVDDYEILSGFIIGQLKRIPEKEIKPVV